MDNIKKQLRFFKILTLVLAIFVLAQFSFWLNVFSSPASTQYNPVQKVRSLQHPKVIDPVVSAIYQFVSNLDVN